MFKWIGRLFGGDSNARVLSDLEAVVEEINALEPSMEQLSLEGLRSGNRQRLPRARRRRLDGPDLPPARGQRRLCRPRSVGDLRPGLSRSQGEPRRSAAGPLAPDHAA